MDKVRFGIIGVGNMGSAHLRSFLDGKIKDAVVTAICDIDGARLEAAKKLAGEDGVAYFEDAQALMRSGAVDAILIATPHYLHPEYAILGLEAGLHIMCEKPAGVYTKRVREMNEAAAKSDKIFALMFNQRTNPLYRKVKTLIASGEMGQLRRVNWIITNWYRTQAYYDSGSWRATWAGEGGGVLLNQDPHQLDLLQWLCGMPRRVHAFCAYGKFHNIEVEDDVTAYFEYDNGATGVFVTSTGDCPGTNRLEIDCDNGQLIIENDALKFRRTCEPVSKHLATCPGGFDQPEVWDVTVPIWGESTQHIGILNNFVGAILRGEALIAPGEEGINGLTLSNAIHLSSWTGKTVELPLDEDLFYSLLQEKIKASRFKKPEVKGGVADLSSTYNN